MDRYVDFMKRSEKVTLAVGVPIIVFFIGLIVYSPVMCNQVKADYESNLELAREKYGHPSFQSWFENESIGDLSSDCRLNIDVNIP